jgi:3-dehydroquinate synthase
MCPGKAVMAEPIMVHHATGTYPVYVQPGLLERLNQVTNEHLPLRRVAMIADAAVHQLYQSGRWGTPVWAGETLTFPSGESSKTREAWARLTDSLLERGFGRDSGVIALGGGVAGDLAGFVAATYMRGLPYIQVPTTLVAMLDASVGGKTGLDTPQGKNLIGSFHPPVAVIADPLTLESLPDREYCAGLAEAVKHGLIADRDYFHWMELQTRALIGRDRKTLTQLIRRSVEIKAEVVSSDEREAGRRAILNAGHTVAHALERASQYQLPHGEAVSLGLIVECELAEQLGIAEAGLRRRVAQLLQRLGLPAQLPQTVKYSAVLGSMEHDKKNRGGAIHFALLQSIGCVYQDNGWTTAASEAAIRKAMRVMLGGVES